MFELLLSCSPDKDDATVGVCSFVLMKADAEGVLWEKASQSSHLTGLLCLSRRPPSCGLPTASSLFIRVHLLSLLCTAGVELRASLMPVRCLLLTWVLSPPVRFPDAG